MRLGSTSFLKTARRFGFGEIRSPLIGETAAGATTIGFSRILQAPFHGWRRLQPSIVQDREVSRAVRACDGRHRERRRVAHAPPRQPCHYPFGRVSAGDPRSAQCSAHRSHPTVRAGLREVGDGGTGAPRPSASRLSAGSKGRQWHISQDQPRCLRILPRRARLPCRVYYGRPAKSERRKNAAPIVKAFFEPLRRERDHRAGPEGAGIVVNPKRARRVVVEEDSSEGSFAPKKRSWKPTDGEYAPVEEAAACRWDGRHPEE